MLRNYVTVAFRNLLKHKTFSLINIAGLSIGITCCILLALFIKDEFSYEKHFYRHQDIYRISSTFIANEREEKLPRTSPPVAMTMLNEFPELESATRVVSPPEVEQHLIRFEDKTFYEKTGYLVDSTFFKVFSYPFEEGDRLTALNTPSSVILSYTLAQKIFGSQSALDQLLIINSGFSRDTFRVTGVLKPYLHKSQLDADFFMGMNSKGWGEYVNAQTTWSGQNFVYSFILVKPGVSVRDLEAKFPALLDKYGAEQMKEMGIQKTMSLQRLQDMHLYSAGAFSTSFGYLDIGTSGSITYVYLLISICVFILLIACINFMNLTTAKASQRAGEVGIRKSMGANRTSLIKQFLGESLTIVTFAMIVSVGLVQILLPMFNQFTQKDLSISFENAGYVFLSLIVISLITGIIAGSYPAFFLSAFQPARVLKDKYLSGNSSDWLRKSLVVFQFVISITLVSAIMIIHKQMSYINSQSLGFDASYKIVVPLRTNEARTAYARLRDRYKDLASVKEVAGTTALPASSTMRDLPLYPEGSSMENASLHFQVNMDENYFDLLDIKLLSGRHLQFEMDTFSWGNATNHILVNQASLRATGTDPDEAIGSSLNIDWQGQHLAFRIEGVVEDFHQFSMHREVAPMIFMIPSERDGFVELCAAVEAGNYSNTLSMMENVWKEVVPNTPFEHTLLSDNIKRHYEADQRVLSIITAFTFIAIIISCLGLYGLSLYVAERRVKEIGIRKVLGASVMGIVGMLSKDFIKLIIIAFVLAVPIGYYTMGKWLESFAYKIELNALVFILAGLASFSIAWLTVGFESVRAALGNPVDSLRRE